MKRINQLESANAELRVQLKAKSTRLETLEGE
jgi:UBX domain-containing protein 11